MQLLLSCNENSLPHLIDEFRAHDIPGSWTPLTETDALFTTSMSFDTLYALIHTAPLVFVRNVYEVTHTVPVKDLSALKSLTLEPNSTFAIRLKSDPSVRAQANEFRKEWVTILTEAGHTLDVKNPKTTLQMFVDATTAYVGVLPAQKQLSNWAFGNVHYAQKLMKISRAEMKLMEVFELLGPKLKHKGLAVDLGAAPGGWSLFLADQGYTVHAIDPAFLDERLDKDKRIHHYAMTSQAYLERETLRPIALLVNDMKMDTDKSISVFGAFGRLLSADGFGIITLKLSKYYRYPEITDALNQLERKFEIVLARQLFHNRHEITVVVRSKHA